MHRTVALLAAGAFLAPQTTAQFHLVDDFSAGHSALWTEFDILQSVYQIGTTNYGVVGGRFRIASAAPLPQSSVTYPTGALHTPSILDPASHANGAVRLLAQVHEDATSIMFVMRANPNTLACYSFALNNPENRIYISRIHAGGSWTNLATSPFPIANHTDYHLEATCFGTRLTLKVWQAGSPEPLQPQLTASDATYTQGAMGPIIYKAPGSAPAPITGEIDDVYFALYPSATSYGSSCRGGGPFSPQLLAAGHPTIGGTLDLTLTGGQPLGVGALMIGMGRGNMAVLGCPILVSGFGSFPLLALPLDGLGRCDWSFPVPQTFVPLTLNLMGISTTTTGITISTTQGLELAFR